jgi:hypothetical protein
VLGDGSEPRTSRVAQKLFAGHAMVDRRPHRGLALLEVDTDEPPAGLQGFRRAPEKRRTVREVVVRVHDHHHVELGGRQVRIVAAAQHRRDVAHVRLHEALAESLEVRQPGIDGVDAAARADGARERQREEAGTGADVGDRRPGTHAGSPHDARRLLPLHPLGREHAADERLEVLRAEAIVAVMGLLLHEDRPQNFR